MESGTERNSIAQEYYSQEGLALGVHYLYHRLDEQDNWIKANDSRMTWSSKQEVERLFKNNPFATTMLLYATI